MCFRLVQCTPIRPIEVGVEVSRRITRRTTRPATRLSGARSIAFLRHCQGGVDCRTLLAAHFLGDLGMRADGSSQLVTDPVETRLCLIARFSGEVVDVQLLVVGGDHMSLKGCPGQVF